MKQISVLVNNEVGSVAQITTVLRENQINLKAICTYDSPDFCILRMIVDRTEDARSILAEKGFTVRCTDVLAVELLDKPGSLDSVLNTMTDCGINLNYIYSFVLRQNSVPLMVMNVNDMEKAASVLKENGIRIIEDMQGE